MKTSSLLSLSAAVGISLIAVACRSTVADRRTERMEYYKALAPELSEAVDRGEIRRGMGTNAVYIAWGRPSKVHQGESSGGRETTWLYYGSWTEQQPYWEFVSHRYGGWTLDYRVAHAARRYLRAEVIFRLDQVDRWQTHPRPVAP